MCGGALLVTWFIIRSCEVVWLGGIKDDKLHLTVGKEGAASAFMKQRGVGKGGGEFDSKSNRAWPLCAICCFMTQEMHKGFADSSVCCLAAPPP